MPTPGLRVAFVSENVGGHATFHSNLMAELDGRGDVVTLPFDLPQRSSFRRIAGGNVPFLSARDADFALLRAQLAQSAVAAGPVRRLAAICDVMHFSSQNVCPVLTPRAPYVVTTDASCAQTVRMSPSRYPARGTALGLRAAQVLERRFLSRAQAIVAQSEWARSSLVTESGVDEERVSVIRLGGPRAQPWIERRTDRRPRVAYVGFSMQRKGGAMLLELLAPDLGRTCDLHLVTTAPVAPWRGLTVHGDVRPGDGRIFSVLGQVDLLVLPSDADMSPNVVLEAMACGLPVVAYDSGAVSEMVIDGVTGIVVRPGDRFRLHQAITGMLESPALRLQYGAAGRRHLMDRYNAELEAGRMVDLLRRVTERAERIRTGG
jgi:glycosyltransferase involved in cell wall biosynthesis